MDEGASRPEIASSSTAEHLQQKLDELQLKEAEQQVQQRAEASGWPYINLASSPISQEALMLLPAEQAQALGVVPFLHHGGQIRLGAVNPGSPQIAALTADIASRHHVTVGVYAISEHSFQHGLQLYRALPKVSVAETGVSIHAEELAAFSDQLKTFRDLEKLAPQTPVTQLVALLLAGGLQAEASDIHLEAGEESIAVRYRLDGILQQVATLPRTSWPQLVSRIKLLSHLKLDVSNESQDGSFTMHLPSDRVEVRVSTVPTAFGESVVLRILRSSQAGLQFEDLGLRGRAFTELLREIGRPNGMVLTTGPTGSGKTTTLYAVLNKLNSPKVKIATLEDPIEYRLAGINQSQINTESNYTFARGLRAILRQDPDIIMVGEIRDAETAETAVNAALTGHMVISTLHTNDAAGALPRLLALGVPPFLLAPALNAVIGQRLVRMICTSCKAPLELEDTVKQRVISLLRTIPAESGAALTDAELQNLTFYHGTGCDECHGAGYRHRTGVYEVFSMNQEIEKNILSGQISEYQVREMAQKAGMVTMAQDGLLKAKDGITTVEEVFRVVE
jgi:type IV pilus assembly protein PilB